jgi:hypothetical protein
MVPTLNSSITASIHNHFLFALELSRMHIKNHSDTARPLRGAADPVLIPAQRAIRVLLCACWSLHTQSVFAQDSATALSIVQPRELRLEGQVTPTCQVPRPSEAACIDQFRPRPTPDELRGCHDNATVHPSSVSRALPPRPAAPPTTNQSPANDAHTPEQPALPEPRFEPSIPR